MRASLNRLFRHTLSTGGTHPLLPVLARHLGQPVPAAWSLAAPPPGPPEPPQARVSIEVLQQSVVAMPSLPQVVHDTLAALQDERASTRDIAESIACDQALAARMLRAANTAFYGASGQMDTVRLAVAVLGLSSVAALLTAVSLMAMLRDDPTGGVLDMAQLSRHSLTSAVVARGLAACVDVDLETAFTGALLHDVGELALASAFQAEYALARQFARSADLPMREAERAVLGLDRGLAGGVLARHWRLPPTLTEAIAAHGAADAASGDGGRLADLVRVADALAHGIGPADADAAVPAVSPAAWARLGIDEDGCLAVLRDCEQTVATLWEVLAP